VRKQPHLASYPEARSPVELSLSPVYQYQFSSIAKVLNHITRNAENHQRVQKAIREMCMPYFDRSASLLPCYLLQTDTSPVAKPHSPSLPDRTYIAIPNNVIPGNKPLTVGYELSFVNLSGGESGWSLPLSIQRVAIGQTASQCALEQLKDLFAHPQLHLTDKLVINTLDSKYGNAHYLAAAHQHKQLVNVVRLRTGMKVWKHHHRSGTGGADGVYGEKYYLLMQSQTKTYIHPKTKQPWEVFQRSILELEADEYQSFTTQTSRGRQLRVELWRYNDMMLRSKDGYMMKDKPFDLIVARVSDAQSGEVVFEQGMFIALCGEHKSTLSTRQGYEAYRCRYDIEPTLRFNKQRLMLTNLQTPEVEHFDNWLLIIQLTNWLLYTASREAHFRSRKWEQYLPENKQRKDTARLSIARTRRAAQELFLTFDLNAFKPQKCKKGIGRQKGQTFTPRQRYKVVKKTTRLPVQQACKASWRLKTEQIE